MKIDCISDLHGYTPELPGGDLLIVAGDLTAHDTWDEYLDFGLWLSEQEYDCKIVIAGNHDNRLMNIQKVELYPIFGKAKYLCDSSYTYKGLKIYGSPWTKNFHGQNPMCMAFGLYYDNQLKERWKKIPKDTDILVTHSPPNGHLDKIEKRRVGDPDLEEIVMKIKPKIHAFGHIHEGYGVEKKDGVVFVNSSIVDEDYNEVNKPIRVILEGKEARLMEENEMDSPREEWGLSESIDLH